MENSAIKLVEVGEIEEYPISSTERLDSHYFLQWNLKRWRGSDTRKRAYRDPEVGFYVMELFFKCQDETPIGTLPTDESDLAFMLNMSTDKFKSLLKRDLSPLKNWYRVMCDNGEERWAHPVVTEFVLEALKGSRANATKSADDRMRKRLNTIRDHLRQRIPGGDRIAQSEERVNAINDYIEQTYPGGSATIKRVTEALHELSSQH